MKKQIDEVAKQVLLKTAIFLGLNKKDKKNKQNSKTKNNKKNETSEPKK